MLTASVHVNFRPLSGNWDGQNWDQQEARCSNNFLSGPTPPVAPGGATAILWQVVGPSDPGSIVFSVSVDVPHSDEVLGGSVEVFLTSMEAAGIAVPAGCRIRKRAALSPHRQPPSSAGRSDVPNIA